eukprot:3473273-Karenia_brevis.AAC.1
MAKSEGWRGIWVQKEYSSQDLGKLKNIVEMGKSVLPVVVAGAEEIDHGLKKLKRSGAAGLDWWTVPQLRALPADAHRDLGRQMYMWQLNCCWPRQLLMHSGVLLGKPDGGDRVIMLLAMVV